MNGHFFLDDIRSYYRGDDSELKGAMTTLHYHPMNGGDQPILTGRVEMPSYTITNRWNNSDEKGWIARKLDAINSVQSDISKNQLKIDNSYNSLNAINREADKLTGVAGFLLRAKEFISSESQRPAQFLNTLKAKAWGEGFNGVFHSTDTVVRYFTDTEFAMQAGFSMSAVITHKITGSKIAYARTIVDYLKQLIVGQLEVGGLGGVANAFKADEDDKESIAQGLADATVNLAENKHGVDAYDSQIEKRRLMNEKESTDILKNGDSVAWFRYNAPGRYKPDLSKWRMGQPTNGTFSLSYGRHGSIHNLLVESMTVTPSKSVIRMKNGEYSSNYYNVDLRFVNAYLHTSHDYRGII